jgi:hypothetical protein
MLHELYVWNFPSTAPKLRGHYATSRNVAGSTLYYVNNFIG